jgi:hypothetical protein
MGIKRPTTTSEVLTAARNLLKRKGWCKGHLARAANGRIVSVDSPKAVAWCMIGAIRRVTVASVEQYGFADLLLQRVIGMPVPVWNDDPHRTKEEVIEAFDKAIIRAKGAR